MNMFKKHPPTLGWGPQVKFLLVGLLITLFMRYVWTFSLANGDEFFFAGLKNTGQIGNYSVTDLKDFLGFIWFEHNGRTADFLSTFVYYFGFSAGKWIVSGLTGFSISLIAYSLTRAWKVYALEERFSHSHSSVAIFVAIFAVFAPAALNTAYVSNMLVYSAAICNYLVFIALLSLAWSHSLTALSMRDWMIPSILAFLVGSSHEQASLSVIVLTGVTIVSRYSTSSKSGLTVFATSGFIGSALMLGSPGLSNKLRRASTVLSDEQGTISKVTNSLYALAVHYKLFPIFLLGLGIAGLLLISKYSTQRNSKASTPLCAASSYAVIAATTLSIPLATGVGQVRVFHYPVILGTLAACYAFYLGVTLTSGSMRFRFVTVITISLFCFLSLLGGFHTYDSQVRNFPIGKAQLLQQINTCGNKTCILVELTGLPVHRGFSGYGVHHYAHTDYMRIWLSSE